MMRISTLSFGLLAMLALQASAIEFLSTNRYEMATEKTVSNELWVATAEAETDGLFIDDLFIRSGSTLTLNSTHEGNLWGAARGTANLNGRFMRNVRLAAQTVRIDGIIDGNAMILADTIIATTNSVIGGDVRLFGASVVLEGAISGKASITALRIATLGGVVGGDIEISAPEILFSRNTRISGDLSYSASKEILPPEGVLEGQLKRIVPEAPPLFSYERLVAQIPWFLAAILAGVAFISLFPMTTAMATQLTRKAPWKCLLIGFTASVILPFVGLMCLSATVGIPLGALTLTAWGVLIYLSRIIVGLVLGTSILRMPGNSIGRVVTAMAIGLAIIYLSALIPSIGLPLQIAVTWLGMGSLILALLQKRRLILKVPDELQQIEKLKRDTKQKEDTP